MKLDGPPIASVAGEVRACLVVRDEALRIASCLEHHRGLGVDRFLVVDNGSIDGTLEFLTAQPDVHVYRTDAGFAAAGGSGLDWRHQVLDAHCSGNWTLVIDADEAFVFPHCENVSLRALGGYLDEVGARGVLALMIDMYGAGDISGAVHTPGAPLLDTCRYFDPGPYDAIRVGQCPGVQFIGGPRRRAFDFSRYQPRPPVISKVPLVRWSRGMRFLLSTHEVTPIPLAPIRAAILHFKFLSDFPERARVAVERQQHFGGAIEYRAYLDRLAEDPELILRTPESVRLVNSRQLVDLGLMVSHDSYEGFASARSQTE